MTGNSELIIRTSSDSTPSQSKVARQRQIAGLSLIATCFIAVRASRILSKPGAGNTELSPGGANQIGSADALIKDLS